MKHVKLAQKRFSLICVLLVLALVAIVITFAMHCQNVKQYNEAAHVISADTEDSNGVTIDIHPRGQSTDKWDKQDEVLKTTLKGIIYEATISNSSENELRSWSLNLNFNDNYFINNAWCGTVEIVQNSENEIKSQTLDLRNLNRDELTLDYHVSGVDTLIELTPGSSFTYTPSEDDGEMPIKSGRDVSIGFILYSYTDDVDLSDYTFEYKLHQGYFDGATGNLFRFLFIAWGFLLILACALMIMSHYYELRLKDRENMIQESLDVFTKFVDAKDPYTEGHSERVAEISREIAARLGFKPKRCQEIYYAALLHDIGKCYVPDEILKKPSRLTDEEFATIKKHTTWGADMLSNYTSIPDAHDAALYHHERYDGRGYPNSKEGEDIPMIARIISVADAYDAMNSDRVYRKKLSNEIIMQELEKNKGKQFDPKVVDVFVEILKEREIGG